MRSLLFFFGRALLERLVESHGLQEQTIAAQTARIVELERALATEKARFEWLTVHVNELKAERAVLFERALDVQIPVMAIERERDIAPAPSGARLAPADVRDRVGYAPAPGRVMRRAGGEPPDMSAQVAEALAAGDLFNDVGDDKAREMGLGWDGEGQLLTGVPRAVAASR